MGTFLVRRSMLLASVEGIEQFTSWAQMEENGAASTRSSEVDILEGNLGCQSFARF